MGEADRYCRDKVAPEGSTLYYCLMFSSGRTRDWITAVRALGEELREVADQCTDLNVGRSKLAWWHEECTRLLAGEPRHPVSGALRQHGKVEKKQLMALLDGALQRIESGGAETRENMTGLVEKATAPLGALAASGCDGSGADETAFAEKLYPALDQARIARSPRLHGWRSFTYLPSDELARAGVLKDHLESRVTSEALAGVVRSQVSHAVDQIEHALADAPGAPSEFSFSAISEARIELANLGLIRRRHFRVLERPVMITPVRKLWIAWRTARGMRD